MAAKGDNMPAILFVSTALDRLDVPEPIAAKAGVAIWSTARVRDSKGRDAVGPPTLFYRLTPAVLAWIHVRLSMIESAVERTPAPPNAIALRTALRESAAKFDAIAAWVSERPDEFSPVEVAAAIRQAFQTLATTGKPSALPGPVPEMAEWGDGSAAAKGTGTGTATTKESGPRWIPARSKGARPAAVRKAKGKAKTMRPVGAGMF